jgi:hypothetical protein
MPSPAPASLGVRVSFSSTLSPSHSPGMVSGESWPFLGKSYTIRWQSCTSLAGPPSVPQRWCWPCTCWPTPRPGAATARDTAPTQTTTRPPPGPRINPLIPHVHRKASVYHVSHYSLFQVITVAGDSGPPAADTTS